MILAVTIAQLRETEVEELEPPVFGDKDVLGLEVAMDDAFLVRCSKAARELLRVVHRLADRDARREAVPEFLAQRLAVEQFHHEIRRALVRADVVDRDEVRMVQCPGSARFLLEAAQSPGVRRDFVGKDLDRDVAADPRVTCAKHLTHPSRSDAASDLVRTDTTPGRQAHGTAPCCGTG